MTLRTLWEKLRKRNKEDYRQFQFCITFAVMLISSFLIMVCSPLIQDAFPKGGDSGKQIFLIFGVAAIGCILFVIYVSRLFLRYKSREIGIFLALGTDRQMLKKSLTAELGKMITICSIIGIFLGAVVSFGIGMLMERIVADVYEGTFAFTIKGFLLSVVYVLVIFLIIRFQAGRAMKRTNVLEVINEQRRREPMKEAVTKTYLISGILLTFAGIFCGLFLPEIVAYLTGHFLGGWMNVFYLLALLGLYRVLVYTVSSHQRGRNPQRYYSHLIEYGMMKFQGGSVVRNMLVITLLLFGGMYAIAYLPASLSLGMSDNQSEAEYSYRYLNDAKEPSEEQINKLAAKHGITVENYREASFLRVFGSGIERDVNEENQLVEDYMDTYALYDVTGVSEYEKLTGKRLEIPQGRYCQIIGSTSYENIWHQFGDMDQLQLEQEQAYLPMQYLDNVNYEALNISGDNGMGDAARFVVSDEDYDRLRNGLTDDRLETQVLFDTDGEQKAEIEFSKELFRIFSEGMSKGMDVLNYYNAVTAQKEGDRYSRDYAEAVVNPENPLEEIDWQFAPRLLPIQKQQLVMNLSTRLLMFTYVFIICIAAVGVIGFTRSESVGLSNKQVFEDIKRLGADDCYRKKLLKKQIQKIFLLPTILGVGLCLLYQSMIMYGNDNRVTGDEIKIVLILALIGAAIACYQYIVYRNALRKTEQLLG